MIKKSFSCFSWFCPDPKRDQLWKWIDGSHMDYTFWKSNISNPQSSSNEPNYCCPNDAPSFCGFLETRNEYKWADQSCKTVQGGYICQKEKGHLIHFDAI